MRFNKSGISPLIATVLLIGFTIVLAALVFRWGGLLFKETTQTTGCESQGRIACTSSVELSLGAVTYDDTTKDSEKITQLIVANEVSSKQITSFNVQVEQTTGFVKTVPLLETLAPGESKDLGSSLSAKKDFYGITRASIKAIHVIPSITQTTSDGSTCNVICLEQKTSVLAAQIQ